MLIKNFMEKLKIPFLIASLSLIAGSLFADRINISENIKARKNSRTHIRIIADNDEGFEVVGSHFNPRLLPYRCAQYARESAQKDGKDYNPAAAWDQEKVNKKIFDFNGDWNDLENKIISGEVKGGDYVRFHYKFSGYNDRNHDGIQDVEVEGSHIAKVLGLSAENDSYGNVALAQQIKRMQGILTRDEMRNGGFSPVDSFIPGKKGKKISNPNKSYNKNPKVSKKSFVYRKKI